MLSRAVILFEEPTEKRKNSYLVAIRERVLEIYSLKGLRIPFAILIHSKVKSK